MASSKAIEQNRLSCDADQETFGVQCFNLLHQFKEDKLYPQLIKTFTETMLEGLDSAAVKAFHGKILDELNLRIQKSKGNEKQVGVKKFQKQKQIDTVDVDEEEVDDFVIDDEASLKKKEEEEKRQEAVDAAKAIEDRKKAELKMQQHEEALYEEENRRQEANKRAIEKSKEMLEKGGMVVLEDPWAKKGKKGKK